MSKVLGGLLSSSSGGGTTPTSTTPTAYNSLPSFAQDAFKSGVSQAQTLSQNPNNFTPADINSDQTAAANLIRQGYTNIDPSSFNSMLSTFTNPFEDQVVNKTINDIRTTGNGLLSDLGSGATAAGGFGGTRQAALESDLIKNLSQQAGDASAQIRSANYNTATQNALNAINSNNSLQSQHQQDLSGLGDFLQSYQTQVKQAPQSAINYLLTAAQGVPAGGGNVETKLSGSTGLLGTLGENKEGIQTALALASMFSDPRLKENVTKHGTRNGFTVYDFNYIGGQTRYRGVMADEVLGKMPDAVSFEDGYAKVDYGMVGFPMEVI